MAQRVLKYSGTATLRTWFEPTALAQTITAGLISNGWGITNLELHNYPSAQAAMFINPLLLNYYNYFISVSVNALPNENPERVRQALYAWFADYFDNISLNLSDDTIQTLDTNTGQIAVQGTITDTRPSVWDNIFGNNASLVDAGTQVLGLSTGTIIVVGLGFLLVTTLFNKKK
jgi:hypothetical protein